MAVHLQSEIENLKRDILTLGAMAEHSVREATRAIENGNETLARGVIEKDINLDQMEGEIEERCLKILALHHPAAIDVRFIVAVLKISNDLERVGNLAVNIAERALFRAAQCEVDVEFDFTTVAVRTQEMLRKSLDALVNYNARLAQDVCVRDDEIDDKNRQMYLMVQDVMSTYPDQVEPLINLLSVARLFERIADHATNIAEDVICMIEGNIIRHITAEHQPAVRP